MKWVIGVVVILVSLIALVAIVGVLLPKSHVVSRSMSFKQSPEEVWRVISDYAGQAKWRQDLKTIEVLPEKNGHALIREIDKSGDAITYETIESAPPKKLVRRIADENLPFGGTWTFAIKPSGQGSMLTLTENGEVYNPIFRFVSRFVMGHTANIDGYLEGLQKELSKNNG